jgi:hypothetical protein
VKKRFDVFWVVRGRVVDWGPLPGVTELADRTRAALSERRGPALVAKDEVDELRLVAAWEAERKPPSLPLQPLPGRDELRRFLDGAGASPRSPQRAPRPRRQSSQDVRRDLPAPC